MQDYRNQLICGTCPKSLTLLPADLVDLTVTSPPYDDLRQYDGSTPFDFECTAQELYRITKPGGVLVWVVSDQTIKGSETLTSFRQAIYFKECGFSVHDTMIYAKENPTPLTHNRYEQQFEYMFVFSKGKPKTWNPLMTPVISPRKVQTDVHHEKNYRRGCSKRGHKKEKIRFNIWYYRVGRGHSSKDSEAYDHPAIFPEGLAEDHILSWTNPGELVFDPFCGSGTTCKMAAAYGRDYLGIDCSQKYLEIAVKRVKIVAALD
jgi:DNA modification methylase